MRHSNELDGSPDRAFKDRIKSNRMSNRPRDSMQKALSENQISLRNQSED
jgi:hypothetical protein